MGNTITYTVTEEILGPDEEGRFWSDQTMFARRTRDGLAEFAENAAELPRMRACAAAMVEYIDSLTKKNKVGDALRPSDTVGDNWALLVYFDGSYGWAQPGLKLAFEVTVADVSDTFPHDLNDERRTAKRVIRYFQNKEN